MLIVLIPLNLLCHNCSSLMAGPFGGIQCPHRADEHRFLLVRKHCCVYVCEPIGELF